MARDTIAPDSTLADVKPTLTDPLNFVLKVMRTMDECRKAHGKDNAFVRIGITGEGKAPYHKIVYVDGEGAEHLFGSYFGEHKDEKYNVHENTWSTRRSSYVDVQGVLAEIRSIGRPGLSRT